MAKKYGIREVFATLQGEGAQAGSPAVFLRFAKKANRIVDSLSANAFGIYVLHYFCVSWLQLALLDAPMSGAAKGTTVFIGALFASWAMSAAFRSARKMARGAEPRSTLPAPGASAPVV